MPLAQYLIIFYEIQDLKYRIYNKIKVILNQLLLKQDFGTLVIKTQYLLN